MRHHKQMQNRKWHQRTLCHWVQSFKVNALLPESRSFVFDYLTRFWFCFVSDRAPQWKSPTTTCTFTPGLPVLGHTGPNWSLPPFTSLFGTMSQSPFWAGLPPFSEFFWISTFRALRIHQASSKCSLYLVIQCPLSYSGSSFPQCCSFQTFIQVLHCMCPDSPAHSFRAGLGQTKVSGHLWLPLNHFWLSEADFYSAAKLPDNFQPESTDNMHVQLDKLVGEMGLNWVSPHFNLHWILSISHLFMTKLTLYFQSAQFSPADPAEGTQLLCHLRFHSEHFYIDGRSPMRH